jgi:hypothetical protein
MSTRLKFRGWKLYPTAVASFACGSVITAHLTHVQEVRADSNALSDPDTLDRTSDSILKFRAFNLPSKVDKPHSIF